MNRVKRKIKRILAFLCVCIITFCSLTVFASAATVREVPEVGTYQNVAFNHFAPDYGYANYEGAYPFKYNYSDTVNFMWASSEAYPVVKASSNHWHDVEGADFRQKYLATYAAADLAASSKYTCYIKYKIVVHKPKDFTAVYFNNLQIGDPLGVYGDMVWYEPDLSNVDTKLNSDGDWHSLHIDFSSYKPAYITCIWFSLQNYVNLNSNSSSNIYTLYIDTFCIVPRLGEYEIGSAGEAAGGLKDSNSDLSAGMSPDIGLDDGLNAWNPFGHADSATLAPAFIAISGFFNDMVEVMQLNYILRISIVTGFFALLVGLGINIAVRSSRDGSSSTKSDKPSKKDKGGG